MRLINAPTKRLHEFFDEAAFPEYAILSHTWGPSSSEVVFSELMNLHKASDTEALEVKAKAGWYKIEQSCAQAVQDGYRYVWIDTVCIDKSSSAELSEAINSMYRWYKNSAICYAYLEDLESRITSLDSPANVETPSEPLEPTITTQELRKARWFQRGWTLQELIAPQDIKFYAAGWNFIGNKASLRNSLSSITNIPEVILRKRILEDASIAHRMSWAAKRTTTRVEDIAYCLLGIFDVNMPLLYGEGEKAFVRLQEEILKDSDDMSIFAWSPLQAPSHQYLESLQLQTPGSANQFGISIFATDPKMFAGSRQIVGMVNRESCYLTNRGVRMTAPMICIQDNIFVLIIGHKWMVDSPYLVGIIVQETETEKMVQTIVQYSRQGLAGLVLLNNSYMDKVHAGTIYVCKKIRMPGHHMIPAMLALGC